MSNRGGSPHRPLADFGPITLPPAVALDILERSSRRDLARFELLSRQARALAKAAFPAIVARMGLSRRNSDELATEFLTAAGSGEIERALVRLELGTSINGRPSVTERRDKLLGSRGEMLAAA